MKRPVPARVVALGLWAGWIGALLFGRIAPLRFEAHPAPEGIFSACALAGYPKQQDWFRYALGLLGGPVGAGIAAFAWRRRPGKTTSGRQRRGSPRPGVMRPFDRMGLGFGCMGFATLGAVLNADAGPLAALVLLPAGVLLCWGDGGRGDPDPPPPPGDRRGWEPGSIGPVGGMAMAAITLLAFLWLFDSCLLSRSVDGIHEGARLLSVQSFLAGDQPGADSRVEYGPLMVHSLWWWMRALGMHFEAYRWWFLALQWAGLVTILAVLRRVVPSPVAMAAVVPAVLVLSPAGTVQFGVPNLLRVALPMAALALADRAAACGVLLAVATLFSPEYGIPAIAAWAAGGLIDRRAAGDWRSALLAGAGTGIALTALMFGRRWPEWVEGMAAGGYGAARLLGHGAMPLPPAPWIGSIGGLARELGQWRALLLLWGPGLLAAGTLAWLVLRPRPAPGAPVAWSAFILLCTTPAIARPAGQEANLVPSVAALAAILIDQGLRLRGAARRAAVAGMALLVLVAGHALWPVAGQLMTKPWRCGAGWRVAAPPPAGLERLGGVWLDPAAFRDTRRAVEAIRRWCPPGDRLYLAAPRYAHLPFLADRAALGPFPASHLAVTAADRVRVVEALERHPPPLALITADGLDVPWAVEHAPERAVILRDYRRVELIGDLEVWVRRR